MQTKKVGLVTLVVLIGMLCIWAPAAWAYYAPYLDSAVTVSIEAVPGTSLVRVSHSIWDPIRSQTRSAVSQAFEAINGEPAVKTGIVYFSARVGTNWFVYSSVYDPTSGQWETETCSVGSQAVWTPPTVIVADGIAAFCFATIKVMGDPAGFEFFAKTYDPSQGAWNTYGKTAANEFTPMVQNGVAVYKEVWDFLGHKFTNIGMAVYDPRDGAWHVNEDSNNDGDLQVWIEEATVKYLDNGGNEQKWGYDSWALRSWNKGSVTTPTPIFLAQPTVGPAPLNVWFTDMSIGCTNVFWEFGDGKTTTGRSSRNTYQNYGTFTVCLTGYNAYIPIPLQTSQVIQVQDFTPPSGGIIINGGAQYTNSTAVTLSISISGADPGSMMRFSYYDDDAFWYDWEPLAATKAWSLWRGDGSKIVYAQFKDSAGNVSPRTSASIILDATPPMGSMTINSGAQLTNKTAVTLNLNAADDQGSGVTKMCFGNCPRDPDTGYFWWPTTWSNWEPYTASRSWNLFSGDGPKQVIALFLDAAGNYSHGSASITVDSTAPAGFSVSINGGAQYTNNSIATVTIDAGGQDTSGMQMAFGHWVFGAPFGHVEWYDWVPYASSTQVGLFGYGFGPTKAVYARFKDAAGNISATVSDSIMMDTIPPVDGTLTANGGKQQVTLNWSGFSDAGSGIKYYNVYAADTSNLFSRYTLVYQTGDTSFTHQNLKKATAYAYKVVAADQVGNLSAGALAQATTRGTPLPFLQLLLD